MKQSKRLYEKKKNDAEPIAHYPLNYVKPKP